MWLLSVVLVRVLDFCEDVGRPLEEFLGSIDQSGDSGPSTESGTPPSPAAPQESPPTRAEACTAGAIVIVISLVLFAVAIWWFSPYLFYELD